jgi:hypothetical protein
MFAHFRLCCKFLKVPCPLLILFLHRLMTATELVLDDTAISVPRINLFLTCHRFLEDPAPAKSAYRISSCVSLTALMQFCEPTQGELPDLTWGNANNLAFLSTESGSTWPFFWSLSLSIVTDLFRVSRRLIGHKATLTPRFSDQIKVLRTNQIQWRLWSGCLSTMKKFRAIYG